MTRLTKETRHWRPLQRGDTMTVFEIGAKLGLDAKSFTQGLNSASKSVSSFASKTKDVLGGAAKAATAAMGVASAGIAAFTKQAVSAYADYEQLVGGVEKLFGESSDLLMAYAKDAYRTAGLSVNEYMETATSFAAALTASVKAAGGSMDEAVEYADTAMQDMSDNANTFGTDMVSIQTAYQGFAKQNYTMLDNLKLGYGGTKAEMERLIEDANKLRRAQGINNDLTIESYADIITAIHQIQVETGIFNTTQKEAAKTISGSIGAAKAAWKNLIIELGKDDGDLENAFNILQESVATVGTNLLPRIEQTLKGISQMIVTSAPEVTRAITSLLPKILPAVIRSAGQLVSGVGGALLSAMPDLMEAGRNLMANLAYGLENTSFEGKGLLGKVLDSFVSNAPYYLQYAKMIVSNLANQLLNVDYGELGKNLSTLFTGAVNSITDLIKSIDFYKVGENIADFLNGIDWQAVASSIFDLLAEGMKALGNIAVSFFANADIGNIMTMIGLLGAPKLLGGLTDYIKSGDGQEDGKAAGMSWSGAFMSGVKAFGLGWSIGTYIRQSLVEEYGEDTVNEKVYKAGGGWLTGTSVLDYITGINKYKYGDVKTAFMPINGEVREIAVDSPIYQKWAAEHTNMPKYGDGGRVTKPTVALIGEKEPETVVPDSKRGQFGNTYNVTINVEGYRIKNDDELAEKMSQILAELSIKEQRSQGGTAWQR